MEQQNWAAADLTCQRLMGLFEFLGAAFGDRGFTDTADDRLGGVASGFLKCGLRSRGPYPHANAADLETLRHWYREHFPDMLVL